MALPTSTSSVSYAGNGSTLTLYPVPFVFFLPTDLSVYKVVSGVSTQLVNGSDYTVTGGGFGSTGNISTTVAYPSTTTIIINRAVPYVQATSLTTGDEFPAVSMEQALDNVVMQTQQLSRNTLPDTATASGASPFVLQANAPGASPTWVPQSAGSIAAGAITNTMLAGNITPSKLSTGGPVWDASGNLTATSFVGNSSTATSAGKLTAAKTIGLSGDVTGTATSFDGSANITISSAVTSIAASNVVTTANLASTTQKQICKAWVNFNGTVTAYTGTYTQSGTTVILSGINFASLGWTTSNTVNFVATSGLAPNGQYQVTSVTSTTITFTVAVSQTTSGNANFTVGTIRSSYNVSSVTKNGTGDYTINFATAMADANYSVGGIKSSTQGIPCLSIFGSVTTTSLEVKTTYWNGSTTVLEDAALVSIQVFGN